ncbi:hypothetical protein DFH28DRAFT_927962 [Melampsora americana]|nr:hypothetical protein DFH28DRAFT_927962 [Melampsora americana]
MSCSDGSHIPGKGASATALTLDLDLPSLSTTLRLRVGNDKENPLYHSKLIGLKLAVANTRKNAPQNTNFFWFFTNSQNALQNVVEPLNPNQAFENALAFAKAWLNFWTLSPRPEYSLFGALLHPGYQAPTGPTQGQKLSLISTR